MGSTQILEVEKRKVIKEYRNNLNKKSHLNMITSIKRISLFFVIVNMILQAIEFFIKQPQLESVSEMFTLNENMIHRNLALIQTKFLARKLELISK